VTALAYHRPATVDEACALLATLGPRARVVAGGTAVAILLKEGLLDVDHLVSLERVALAHVAWSSGTLTIGAMATHQVLAEHPLVRTHVPVLAEVLAQVASRRIRNVATIGGNLCWAEAASDPPGLLMALGARVTATSARGRRELAVRELFQDYFTTALAPDEVLTEVAIPAARAGTGIAYIKFTPQSRADKPVLGVTALLRRAGDRCADAAVVVGAAGPVPLALPDADAVLVGGALDATAIDTVAARYAGAAQPVSDTRGSEGYKRRMIRVLIGRALRQAWARTGEGTANRAGDGGSNRAGERDG
jgi:aerobic carbon-monoxide dehydrogenase medium subunit